MRNGVAIVVQQVEEREKAASDAMKGAQLLVAQYSGKAAAIKNLPPVPPASEAQCATIVQEQKDDVQSRHR